MTRIVRDRTKRTPLLLMALVGLVLGVLIGGGGLGSAAPSTDASVVDYSQCANGNPGTTPSNICNSGWINGILNANNSQYAENQVTAQRLVVSLPNNGPTTDRTVTLKYLWNKGVHHAYDSLAKWNTTINGLDADDVCDGVPGGASGCPVTTANYNNGDGDDQFQVPSSPCSAGKELADRNVVIYGGDITNISTPVNDSPTCSTSADQYETVTITYDVTSTPTRVMFLFGGHLAKGLGANGWGAGFGSSEISGGPYHIKLIQLDTSSIGNRDNQIMSGAILALTPSMSTTPTHVQTFSEELNDSATITGIDPSGTMTFRLYDTLANCQLGGTTVGSGGLLYQSVVTFTANGSDTRTLANTSGTTSGSNSVNASGDYYWSVFYSGDGSLNLPASSECLEHSNVTAPVVVDTGA